MAWRPMARQPMAWQPMARQPMARQPGRTGEARFVPEPPAEHVAALAARFAAAGHARLGRSLGLFHVDAGDCGGCALELAALRGGLYALRRFGLHFVASPRHADVLLVTGPVTRNLREALEQAAEAAAAPCLVVALGDCAVDGGLFRGGYASGEGVAPVLAPDLLIRGCPPGPAAILTGLCAILEAQACLGAPPL